MAHYVFNLHLAGASKILQRRYSILTLCVVALSLNSGCTRQPAAPAQAKTLSPQEVTQKIQEIQNNPNIPADKKASAIAEVQLRAQK